MSGSVTGGPKLILRLEGLGVLALSAFAYGQWGSGWLWFAVFFLAPDLGMLGYLGGKKLGATSYNLSHSYIGAILCLAFGCYEHMTLAVSAGLIWAAHIGFDRLLGYGLKYASGFGDTHLGVIGRPAKTNDPHTSKNK